MNIILFFLPYLISFCIGILLIDRTLKKESKISPLLHSMMAVGLGLGLSSHITFYVLLIFDHLNKALIITIHLILLALLSYDKFRSHRFDGDFRLKHIPYKNFLPIAFILAAFIPIWMQAKLYPWGGWDAWSVWNFKAKFIFLGGGHWKNLFDPLLWRSSPHYPLLLSLVNVWGWTFLDSPNIKIPYYTSLLFTFTTIGFLYASLRELVKKPIVILAALILATSPFFVKLAISQYCDIVIAYYLLVSLFCIISGQINKSKMLLFFAGLFLGFLSFTKSESCVAAFLIIFLTIPYIWWSDKSQQSLSRNQLTHFLFGTFIAVLPTLLFEFFYSPGNQTFINGLLSVDKPSNLFRLKMTLSFLLVELQTSKWNGIWILMGIGLILSQGRCFTRNIRIIPLFLFSYLFIICFYYYLNTYFKITWWLQVSLHRILFSLLPTLIFWVFYSIWKEKSS